VKYLFATFSFLLFFNAISAQTLKLSGKVLSSKNDILGGASVKLEGPTKINFAANVDGTFSANVLAGKYTITVSRVGYTIKVIDDLEVKAGQDNSIEIVLEEQKTASTDVVVRSSIRKESTSALVNFQRNNTSLSSGLAADFIKTTPDRNMGEVLKRVSGTTIQDNKFVVVRGLSDRYNQAMLNNAQMPSSEPDKKQFSFDVIPSMLVDNVIINKTATPDLTGEFAGGLIQIQTKDVPTKDIFSVGISLGYNSVSTFNDFTSNKRNSTDWLGFDDGTRSIPAGVPANRQQFSKNNDEGKAAIARLFDFNGYNRVTTTAAPIQSYNLTWGKSIKFKNNATIGLIAGLVYRQSKTIYEGVERNRYDFDRTNTNNEYIFKYKENQNIFNVNLGAIANVTFVKGKHKISWKNLYNRNLEDKYVERTGTNLNNNALVNFNSSFLNQRGLYSTQLEGNHQLTSKGIKFMWNLNGSANNKTQPDYRVVEYRRNIATPNATPILNDDETRRFYSELGDYSAGFNTALTIPFKIKETNQILKIGGSSLLRGRNFTSRNFQYAGSQAALTRPLETIFQPDNIAGDKLFLNEITQNTDKYFGISVLNGMYFMLDNKLSDQLRLVWGVRAENFQQFLRTRDLANEGVVINTEKWDMLPSMNLTYNINNRHQVRFAASLTVARPEFREIAPFAFFDYDAIYGISGNPDLKRTSITNLDARYEFYPNPGEAISFGLFYKDFKDPIEFVMNPASNADRQNYEYRNALKARTYGVEIEIRKKINKTLSVFSNLTYISSKVTFNNLSAGGVPEDASRPLQGQAPYLFNAGLQYTNTKSDINASLLYNRVGPKLYVVGSPPPGAGFYDIYEKSRDQVDLQLSKKLLNKRAELKITVSDLLNQYVAQFDNLTSKVAYKEATGDRYISRYRPGTTVTVGFTYDIFK
jgi:TonB-dependent receptor